MLRPAHLSRLWRFVEGADEQALLTIAPNCGADVLVRELEDFTPIELRPKARALAPEVFSRWREAGAVAAVRVNPLESQGMDDLVAVMRGAPSSGCPRWPSPVGGSCRPGAIPRGAGASDRGGL